MEKISFRSFRLKYYYGRKENTHNLYHFRDFYWSDKKDSVCLYVKTYVWNLAYYKVLLLFLVIKSKIVFLEKKTVKKQYN